LKLLKLLTTRADCLEVVFMAAFSMLLTTWEADRRGGGSNSGSGMAHVLITPPVPATLPSKSTLSSEVLNSILAE